MCPENIGNIMDMERPCECRWADEKVWNGTSVRHMKARRLRLAGHVLRLTEDRAANVAMRRKKDREGLVHDVRRRPARFRGNIQRCKEDRQWPQEMEEGPRCSGTGGTESTCKTVQGMRWTQLRAACCTACSSSLGNAVTEYKADMTSY